MPIERDPESTAFDSRPWGGQQRLVPLAARFARGTAAPQADVSGVIAAPSPTPVTVPALPRPAAPIPASQDEGFRERPTIETIPVPRVSHPVEIESSLPSLTSGSIPAPSTSLPTVAMKAVEIPTDVNPAQPAFIPVKRYPAMAIAIAPLEAPVPAVAVSAAKRAPRAIAAYSVKHGCALGGFVVPHLPKVAEVFRHSDSTIAVRRRPLTARSLVAIPIGAVLATVAILLVYLAQPAQATTKPSMGAAALVTEQPQVLKMTIAEPAPVAPVVTRVAEPTVSADAITAMETVETRGSSSSRHRASKHKKPQRIVAVDASTPLGNLRVGRN
jgi:hypothetical protein